MKSMIVLKPKDDHMPKIHIKNNCNIELINVLSSLFFLQVIRLIQAIPHISVFSNNLDLPMIKKGL